MQDPSRGMTCTCPDSCLQDIGMQDPPVKGGRGHSLGESYRARIDSYRRQDSGGSLGVPREKRSHSLAAPGSLELAGSRRCLRPDALLFRGGFVRSKFKNRHQLSVQESLEFSDDVSGFPGTPPPQATPPVHKDMPIMTSRLAKKLAGESGFPQPSGVLIKRSSQDDQIESNADENIEKNVEGDQ